MCKWGNHIDLDVPMTIHTSHMGKEFTKRIGIDRCIAPIVKALNDVGIKTEECCCGHSNAVGYLTLHDKRVFVLVYSKIEWNIARDAIMEYRCQF